MIRPLLVVSLLWFTLALALTGTALAQSDKPASLEVTTTPFPHLRHAPVTIGCVDMVRGETVRAQAPFGGISSMLWRNEDFLLVSDAGRLYQLPIVEIVDGLPVVGDSLTHAPIISERGKPLSKREGDAESITYVVGKGEVSGEAQSEIAIGFEGDDRISIIQETPDGWQIGRTLLRDDDRLLGGNSGYEAMTQLASGELLALSEATNSAGLAKVMVGNVGRDGKARWSRGTPYRPADDFAVTDIAQDPRSGDVIILERAFSPLTGPRARLARLPAQGLLEMEGIPSSTAGPGVRGVELARFSLLHGIDNMEAMALQRRASDGALLAVMMSDDNFNPVQTTVLLGLVINETEGCLP